MNKPISGKEGLVVVCLSQIVEKFSYIKNNHIKDGDSYLKKEKMCREILPVGIFEVTRKYLGHDNYTYYLLDIDTKVEYELTYVQFDYYIKYTFVFWDRTDNYVPFPPQI